MKNLIQAILVMVSVLFCVSAQAQIGTVSPSGAVRKPFTTNTGPIAVLGLMTTNFTSGAQIILPIPKTGFGVQVRVGATNALSVTNCTFILEGIVYDSANVAQVVDNVSWTVTLPVNGTTGYDYHTNLLNSGSVFNFWGIDGVRIRSFTNVNSETIFLTNLYHKTLAPDPLR